MSGVVPDDYSLALAIHGDNVIIATFLAMEC